MCSEVQAAWTYSTETDALTDEKISMARGAGASTASYVILRCTGNKLEAYVSVGEFLTVGDGITVRYRVDKKMLMEEVWRAGDGSVAFAPRPEIFATNLGQGSSLLLEAFDHLGQPHRATFPLAGAEKHVRRVLKECSVDPESLAKRTANSLANSIVLEFGGSSIVRVEDGRGETLAIGLMRASEKKVLNGEPPFTVFVGNAKNVKVIYNGEVVDFASHINSQNDTARFTVP